MLQSVCQGHTAINKVEESAEIIGTELGFLIPLNKQEIQFFRDVRKAQQEVNRFGRRQPYAKAVQICSCDGRGKIVEILFELLLSACGVVLPSADVIK